MADDRVAEAGGAFRFLSLDGKSSFLSLPIIIAGIMVAWSL
jgi:hypothetical protein